RQAWLGDSATRTAMPDSFVQQLLNLATHRTDEYPAPPQEYHLQPPHRARYRADPDTRYRHPPIRRGHESPLAGEKDWSDAAFARETRPRHRPRTPREHDPILPFVPSVDAIRPTSL